MSWQRCLERKAARVHSSNEPLPSHRFARVTVHVSSRQERLAGAFIEMLIALFLFYTMAKQQATDELLVGRYGHGMNMV